MIEIEQKKTEAEGQTDESGKVRRRRKVLDGQRATDRFTLDICRQSSNGNVLKQESWHGNYTYTHAYENTEI